MFFSASRILPSVSLHVNTSLLKGRLSDIMLYSSSHSPQYCARNQGKNLGLRVKVLVSPVTMSALLPSLFI
jgi:hypothetical protein